jgi:aryl-alcohol dehydrogenase-like predicted oxidoreductase
VLASKVQVPEREAVETSLRLLRTDVIDIMMLHSAPLGVLDNGEAGEALLRLKDAGLFRFAGVSVYGNEAALAAIRSGMFDCVQIAYSPLDRRPEMGVLGEAARRDVGLIARSVLLKGALTHRAAQLPDALAPIREAAGRLARFGELPEVAYRYVLSQESPQTALVGTADVGELEQAVGFAGMGPLDGAAIEAIRAEPMLDEFFLNPGNWPAV